MVFKEVVDLRIEIIRFVDAGVPGWVECRLVDFAGREHFFDEKLPIVSAADIWADSAYPQPGVIACFVVERRVLPDGREVVTVDTEQPVGVASRTGQMVFEVFADQLTANPAH